MKKIIFQVLCVLVLISGSCRDKNAAKNNPSGNLSDSLPSVLAENHSDLIYGSMQYEAALRFSQHVLPHRPEDLIKYKQELRRAIIEKAGIIIDHDLPLNMEETGTAQLKGYTVKNILFQTRPGVCATANLYIPDGQGPFPGVINMLGHWTKGKIDSTGPQAVGHTLATNGYVCLTVDPWGAGERTTIHGDFEYHGANLGASLMNVGESLLGVQVSDNMRGIDLLCSLPQVDPKKIGATGASGGGNQTMWLSAVDERVKASVPVVSVGSFESYIMRSNCICELFIDGLTLTEESGILVLANAPLMINHSQDDNPTFFPSEMLRSYSNAKKAFIAEGVEKNIAYRIFDLPHGYMKEDREAMLGWFSLHLKNEGTGEAVKEIAFTQLPEEKLMVFAEGQRDKSVVSTDQYCIRRGAELKDRFMNSGTINAEKKKSDLRKILRTGSQPEIVNVKELPSVSGWEVMTIEKSDKTIIPLLLSEPSGKGSVYTVLCNSGGKDSIPMSLIDEYRNKGEGIVIVDLKGVGEQISTVSKQNDQISRLHTLSRAELWLGRSVMGEWARELDLVTRYFTSEFKASKVNIDGTREAGLAALFLAATDGKINSVTLREAPVSYVFDSRENVDFFTMGIHLPGFLVWGDVSLAAALTGRNVTFIDPLTMSGGRLSEEDLRAYSDEYARVRQRTGLEGITKFK